MTHFLIRKFVALIVLLQQYYNDTLLHDDVSEEEYVSVKLTIPTGFIEKIVKNNFGMNISGLWFDTFPEISTDYDHAKEIFLFVLESLLRMDKVRLAHNGTFLGGEIEEQIQAFRDSWPSWDVFDEDIFYISKTYEVDGKQFADWWIPGGLVWIGGDGSLYWT